MDKNSTQTKMHEIEISINDILVQRLLLEQFPHFAEKPLSLVHSTGTVNALYRLGNDLCVRLPRTREWAQSLVREFQWLDKLAPHISLHIPQPFVQGKPCDFFPYPWAIYRWIEGSVYQNKDIHDETQAAKALAKFISELRSVDQKNAPSGGRPPLMALDADVRSAILSINNQEWVVKLIEVWNFSLKAKPWKNLPVWIHGDLIKPNVLVNEGKINAIIDFGGVGVGDPAEDVIPAWSVFTGAGREVFRQELDVDDQTWQRSRGYALCQAAMIIPYYSDTNPFFVSMAKETIEEILAEFQRSGN